MHRSRLLLASVSAGVLVLTGASTAAAAPTSVRAPRPKPTRWVDHCDVKNWDICTDLITACVDEGGTPGSPGVEPDGGVTIECFPSA